MNRRDFIKIAGLFGLSAFLPKGLQVLTYTDLMMKVADGQTLDSIEREQLRQYLSEIDTNRQLVSTWQQINKKVSSSFLDLPIVTIKTKKFEQNTTSETFDIPPDYNHLIIFCAVETDNAAYYDFLHGQFNGDTGNNYAETYAGSINGAASNGQFLTRDDFGVSITTGSSATTGAMGSAILFIPHYNSNQWKTVIKLEGTVEYAASQMLIFNTFATWKSTNPVRSIRVFPETGSNILSGSIITVLGVK